MELRKELEQILGEAASDVSCDQNSLAEELDTKDIVLFGAGNMGRQFAAVLLEAGLSVVAFADNQQKLWNTISNGVRIISPEVAASRYGSSAVFVITLWHPCVESDVIRAKVQLQTLGAERIVTFSALLGRYPELLPRMFWSPPEQLTTHTAEILQTFDLLADVCSRRSYLRAVRLRLFHDFEAANHIAQGRQYFPQDVFALSNNEVFVDCGAYDGDSMSDFIAESGGKFSKIIAFEADPHNARKLRSTAEGSTFSQAIKTFEMAVGGSNRVVRFSAEGVAGSSISISGTLEVQCSTLDTALIGESPTIIKMDIEGAESEALSGARQVIAAKRPILAICIYHRPADLWELPAQMLSLMPNSNIYLRSYSAEGFDLVCYAVPHEREFKVSQP